MVRINFMFIQYSGPMHDISTYRGETAMKLAANIHCPLRKNTNVL